MFIFPLEGDNPTRHTHYVLWGIIVICCCIFFFTLINGAKETYQDWGHIPASSENINILTSMFLHGGYWHILGNMSFLWMFGDNIEDVIGHFFFFFCYLICGIVATLFYSGLHPDSLVPLVGASGAISGIVGMYLVFFPKVSAELIVFFFYWELHRVKTTIFIAISCWFGLQVILGLLIESTSIGQVIRIAFSAHIGGFLTGFSLGYFFVKLGYIDRYLHEGRKHWLWGYAI